MSWRDRVRFGTSTWTYPGWQGVVYEKKHRKSEDYLADYARDPRFTTVGVDSFFYRPPSEETLRRYADALPEGFLCCAKVWEDLTVRRWPKHARYGAKGGQPNPHFLDPKLCQEVVLEPFRRAFVGHTGPLIFQFPVLDLHQRDFAQALDRFFGALGSEIPLAVEVRNRNYLTPRYFRTLQAHGVAHCFNAWTHQKPFQEQVEIPVALTAQHVVARLLLAPGVSYPQAVAEFQPYSAIQRRQGEIREGVYKLVRQVVESGRDAFVLVNNRLEGSSPFTISEILEQIEERQKAGQH